MLCVFNASIVFAEGEDSDLTEVIGEQITEEQNTDEQITGEQTEEEITGEQATEEQSEPTAEAELPTSTPELTEEPVDEGESENTEDENIGNVNADDISYEVVQVPTGEYAAMNIGARDLEVYVTDGIDPIPGAAVTVGGQTLTTGEDGIVTFESLPTSYEKYVISVTSEVYGEKSSDVVLEDSILLGDSVQSVDTKVKYAISYWSPENEIMPMSNSATGQSNPWTYDVNSGLSTGGDLYEYNGMIYLVGEYNRVYNPATGAWTILTGGYTSDSYMVQPVFYDGKIYEYSAWWAADGDGWRSPHKMTIYNIVNNTYHVVRYASSGGKFYGGVIACNDRIYFSGGTYVEYDMDVAQDYFNVDVYDINGYSISYLTYGGTDCPVLCTQPGEYYNHIFYFGNSGDILCVNTSDNSYEFLSGGSGYTNLYEEMVCTANNKVYFMGGATDSELEYSDMVNTVRIYDMESGTWSTGANMPYATAGATPHLYGGRIYLVGGYYAGTNVQIYDIATNTWSSGVSSSLSMDTGKSALLNEKIYIMSLSGTLCIYQINGSQGNIRDRIVSAGTNHIIYINDGSVFVSGDNTYGQLGTGDTVSHDSFVEITGSWEKDIVKVAAGGNTTFALTKDNILYGWGRNNSYQVGNGTNQDVASPTQIMNDVLDVRVGAEHVIVLKTNGDVYGWGNNRYGQICSTSATTITEPYKIASQSTLIAAGDYHTFYNDSNRTLHGMGRNSSYQVGYPEEVEKPVQVECGSEHTVAIDCNGHMYVWGSNSSNQLCTSLPNSATGVAHPYDTGIVVSNIAASGVITLFMSDRLYINNAYGSQYNTNKYEEITGLAGKTVTGIAVSTQNCVAVDDNGAVWRFGYMINSDCSLGRHGVAPYDVEYPYAINQVDSYRNQTLAINELGQVVAWGEGYFADRTDSTTIVSYPTVIEGIQKPIQVSRGKNHNLVLDKNGDVWCWGSNSNNPMTGSLPGKVRTATKMPGISDVKQIAAGTEFSLFLKNDGTLWGVGKNENGQLGQGNTTNYKNPVKITNKSDFIKVSVGEYYVAALASDGIYTWGGNFEGQLGNGLKTSRSTPAKVDATLGNNEHFVDVSAGMDFCLALTNLGNVYAWGDNGSGDLGYEDRVSRYVPTKVPNLSNVMAISAGKSSALAITESGSVYGWGYNLDGQLGFYQGGSVLAPKLSTTLSGKNIKKITLGYDFSVCVDVNGKIYSSGNNKLGQLGVFSTEAKLFNGEATKTTQTIESPDEDNAVTYTISAGVGEEYVMEFVAQSSGTYKFSTESIGAADVVVAAYRDSNFTYPYEQISSDGDLEIGVEQGDSVYLRFISSKNNAFSTTVDISKASSVVVGNKTIYMVLYDSYCGNNDGLWPRYYGTGEDEKFQYSEKFFVNYLKLFKNTKVAFAISIRDLDFDCEPVSNANIGKDSPSLSYSEIISKNVKQKVVSGCDSYYRRIIHNIVNAYNALGTNERPNEFPELYLGTPHFNGYAITDTDKGDFSDLYLSAVDEIYTNLTTVYSDDLPSINPSLIKGMYFGRETPEIRENNSPERLCLQAVSDYVHSRGKKLLWVPFTLGKPDSLSLIGNLANTGRYTDSKNKEHDLFDIIAIQPGLYFAEINSSTTDQEFTQTIQDIKSCVNNPKTAVYSNGAIVNGEKVTNTKVTFQIEYDNSLITGRKGIDGTEAAITQKVWRFSTIVNEFKTFIYDNRTPICIYSGGPNEQNYTYSPGSNGNQYRHSNRNHITLWNNGHMQKYSDFLGHAGNAYDNYNGDIIYDITNGLVNNNWSAKIQNFWGGNLTFNGNQLS